MKFCTNCGFRLEDGYQVCPGCGAPVTPDREAPQQTAQPQPAPAQPQYQQPQYQQPQYQQPQYQQPQTVIYNTAVPEKVPDQYKPLSAWTYVALELLFIVPIVGFISWIIFCFNDSNLNRRAFARHFFCWFIIGAALCSIAALLALIFTGSIEGITDLFS